MGSQQGCSLVRLGGAPLASSLGHPPLLVLTLGWDTGFWEAPSEGPAQLFYLFLQSNGGGQGSPMDFPQLLQAGFQPK